MTPKKKYRIQAHATTKTYVSCWIAARRALDIARQKQAGNLYFRMMAGVFCAFTIEAFLNHSGQRCRLAQPLPVRLRVVGGRIIWVPDFAVVGDGFGLAVRQRVSEFQDVVKSLEWPSAWIKRQM